MQKTAYEMLISDWSSDVCSSDLGMGGVRQAAEDLEIGDKRVHLGHRFGIAIEDADVGRLAITRLDAGGPVTVRECLRIGVVLGVLDHRVGIGQIGSAS